jgi:hypothetical protein
MADKWEYMSRTLEPMNKIDMDDLLNTLGAQGWELCCSEYGRFIFKRRKNESDE